MKKIDTNLWSNWKVGIAGAAALSAGAALISAWLTPRGPITTSQTLISMIAALVIGGIAGFLTGSRWSILITPAVFMGVFELARLGVEGPTVDSINLGSTYGIIAFVLGRLAHGLFVLIPMVIGTQYGIWLSGRLGNDNLSRIGAFNLTLTILFSVLLITIAFYIARPASTYPIVGPNGEPVPDSIAELTTVPIGGHEQAMMIRGKNIHNPVLLYLAGGPGGTDLGAMRGDVSLEQDFVVVTWEQRGAGKSYSALDPAHTLTLDQMVSDTIELTDYLRERFDEDKIYLVGNSWGTTLGVLAAQQHPEKYYAFVGTGQMVSQRETDIMFFEDTLQWAEQNRNENLVNILQENGPPPYNNLIHYEPSNSYEHEWNPYPELDTSLEMPAILFVPEYNFMDRINGFRGLLDTFSILYPQLQEIDFRQDVPKLDIPIYIVIGKHEARGRAVLAKEWFEMVEAPTKEMIIFEHSGHRPLFEEPGNFASVLTRILDETYAIE
jgi:pimeloyl-ACP methyl ester carboxylesterase